MSIPTEDQGGDPRGQTLDYEAALAKINAEHEAGFALDPAAAGGEPAPTGTGQAAEPTTPDQPTQAAREASPETPGTDAPAPTAEEVRISKKEWEQLQRQVGQYGQNLAQQRAEFDQRVQQAIAGQGPDIERRIADAAREAKREAIRELIRDVPDPALRQQQAAVYQEQWNQEDARVAGERRVAEAEQLRTQAGQQIQHAQQLANSAQAQMVATAMPDFLAGFAPTFAERAGALLGSAVPVEEIRAFVAQPEIVELARQEAFKGPAAIDALGETLIRLAVIDQRRQSAAKEAAAAAKREARDNAGLGRGQGGGTGGGGPVDMEQFKSTRERQGNYEGALAAINDAHMRQFAGRR